METSPAPVEVFYSFAEADAPFLEQLEKHLSVLQRERVISTWHRRRIVAGSHWKAEVDRHLITASLILLLVSSDFLASDYCYGTEMQRALQRHEGNEAIVVPLLLRPCDWQSAPFAFLQPLPSGEKPIALWSNRDAAWIDVVQGIKKVLESMQHLSSLSAFPEVWNVPYRRNLYFTGRDEFFELLDQHLALSEQTISPESRRVALTQPRALTGLGGIGKTQIAVEYAYRAREHGLYTHTLWVNASAETLLTDFSAFADLLPSIPMKDETDQQKRAEAVKRWLKQCKERWLLIFDNADDVALVLDYLPQSGNGSVLLTTRAHAVGAVATPIEVETMGFVEGTQLLLRRAQRFEHASSEAFNQAGNIVIALDHFPLALDQAGAYIEETQCSFQEYLALYQTHRQQLLAERGELATEYPDSVATTWLLSFQKVQQTNPAAAELLQLCSFLAPDHIPEELIKDGATHWPALLQRAAIDSFAFNQMFKELLNYSLMKRLAEDRALSIHRLVQAVQRDRMGPGMQRLWAERVIQAMNTVFPDDPQNVDKRSQCLRYLDQAQACNILIEQYTLSSIEAMNLLSRAASYLVEHSLYTIAEPLYRRILVLREQQVGPEHADTAHALHGLAHIYREQGKDKQAEPLFQRALHILEQELGPEHPDIAHTLHALATIYQRQGYYEQAELLYQRALHIGEHGLGPEHPNVAHSLHGLAHVYEQQGKYEQAEQFYQRALHIREGVSGQDHFVAQSMHGLASVYRRQGKYEQAEPLFQQTLRIWEQWLGESEHPNIARSLHGLAHIYEAQGKYDQAELHFLRALAICKERLGVGHPDVAATQRCLAIFYRNQGRAAEAETVMSTIDNAF